MPEFEILCPIHGKREQLDLPESYFKKDGEFEGDIVCSGGLLAGRRFLLNVRLSMEGGQVHVARLERK